MSDNTLTRYFATDLSQSDNHADVAYSHASVYLAADVDALLSASPGPAGGWQPEWLPIESAPKVPDVVIALGAYDKYGSWLVEASSWCEDPSDGEPWWLAWDYNMPPTHWTSLPVPPRSARTT